MPAKTQTLEEAFVDEIRDLYDAEKQIVKTLPKMAKAAHSDELKAAFQEHLEQTKGQVSRLEQIFEMLDEKAKSKPCKGMKGLLEEGAEIIEEGAKASPPLLDLELIGAAQKVEHYEISGYGTVRTFAEQMGRKDVAQLLEETLTEEAQTDKKLSQIAKGLYKEAARDQNGGSQQNMGTKGTGAGTRKRAAGPETDEDDVEDVEMEEQNM